MRPVGRGRLLDRHPYVRVGTGPRPLVVLPGFGDAMFGGRYPPGFEWGLRWYFSRYVDGHAVYLISRQRGLPAGYTIGEMAEDHAGILDAELGTADVLGISMGGLIGQELARRYPSLVDRLVLANSGCRIADVEPVDGFIEMARGRDWAAIRAELAAAMFSDARAVAYPAFLTTVGRPLQPRPADPEDVVVSLEAIRRFDGCDALEGIRAPTLVFGGTDDPYFTEEILRETAAGIPDAELELVDGGKHGAFHERKARFDADVVEFLRRRKQVPV